MMRLRVAVKRLVRPSAFDPRAAHADRVRAQFAGLDDRVIDRFFANFGFTMPPSLLARLQDLCRECKPELVVEFGSGVSTHVLSAAVAGHSGLVVSIDDSPEWVRDAQTSLDRADNVVFVCAPRAGELGPLNHAALARLFAAGSKPGLVVIDGPAHGDRFSEGAMDLYRKLLSRDAICAVDDTDRADVDAAAGVLAEAFELQKRDYVDPIFPERGYSLLLPSELAASTLPAVRQ